jgi:limonene-1,2-epoxide hydrolase
VTVSVEDASAVFDRRVKAWLAADVDGYLSCWHDDLALTLPGGRVVTGIDAYRRMVEQSFAWAAPVSFDIHALAVDGDRVLSDWTIRARRRDDGVEVEWHGLSICELRDGRITWWREHHLAPPVPIGPRRRRR